ncbi:MAG: DUF2797 domain-containing protein [Oleiphilus sp.]
MTHIASGKLQKMLVKQAQPVDYFLRVGEQEILLNDYLGQHLKIEASGEIHCIHCQRKTKTSFNQGYCFPCFKSLAQCDRCIMSPELCHFAQGTCRQPEWGEEHCFQDHIVYLANSSGLKVGITRHNQVPVRWIDQGAVAALPIFSVSSRYLSGLVEVALKEWVADKTNWRKMLKHEVDNIDLLAERDRVLQLAEAPLAALEREHPGKISRLSEPVWDFAYPNLAWPQKITTHNLDKTPLVEGVLQAIKGQYLIFDTGCLNLRKFTSYHVSVSTQ